MGDDEFRVPEKTFKRAAKKSIEHISQIPRSILKKRLAEMDLANADLSRVTAYNNAVPKGASLTQLHVADDRGVRRNPVTLIKYKKRIKKV